MTEYEDMEASHSVEKSSHAVFAKKTEDEDMESSITVEGSEKRYPGFWSPPCFCLIKLNTDADPLEIIGDSAYVFFLIHNFWAKVVGLLVVAFQFILFILFLQSLFMDDHAYYGTSRVAGVVCACLLLLMQALPVMALGINLILVGLRSERYKNKRREKTNLVWVGFVMFAVSIMTIVTGIAASLNADTLILILTQVCVAFMIEKVDENMFVLLKFFSSASWFEGYCPGLHENYGHVEEKPLGKKDVEELVKKILKEQQCSESKIQ